MKYTSILAIYALFWAFSFFLVLPFRLRVDDTDDAAVAGEADGAPHRFSFARTSLWTSIVAAVLFAIFYANWAYGWVGADVMDFLWRGSQG